MPFANRKKYLAYHRRYYKKHKKQMDEANMRWYQEHKERELERRKQWYKKNQASAKAKAKAWRSKNRTRRMTYEYKRRAEKHGNGGAFTVDEWLTLKSLYGNRCLCCGRRRKLEPDHVIPLSKSGRNDIRNIQPLCGPCNRHKRTNSTDYRRAP